MLPMSPAERSNRAPIYPRQEDTSPLSLDTLSQYFISLGSGYILSAIVIVVFFTASSEVEIGGVCTPVRGFGNNLDLIAYFGLQYLSPPPNQL